MTTQELASKAAAAKGAARVLAGASNESRRCVLIDAANAFESSLEGILRANALDLAAYEESGPGRDRLSLSTQRVQAMATSLREIADAPDPLFETVDHATRPNGLAVQRLRVPLGVIGVVYENRPNVTSDVAGLCLRSGNAALLRGSTSALNTNTLLVQIWQEALERAGLPRGAVALIEDPSRAVVVEFMQLTGFIDCLIPRGGPGLVEIMREHARVPYVLDGAGNCHIFVDESANLDQAIAIVRNAKTSRPGVCNAVETLIVHDAIAEEFLVNLARAVPEVELRGDARAKRYVPRALLARDEDFAEEFLDLVLAVKTVDSLDEAIEHVARYGTGHSEAILTTSERNADEWVRRVDAAAVIVNASTRFVDGFELGLGGEVGISTQKLHARGPMGLRELTCLKWVLRGEGQIR
ncbi:MAG: glutamate-5-semialdehyde dehydrogenase [Acidimicrobiales bacterium]